MNSKSSQCRDIIRQLLTRAGAFTFGIARAEPVDESMQKQLTEWLHSGSAADMDWMHSHLPIRLDPRLLLPGARSIIVAAFAYLDPPAFQPGMPRWASYALGDDYHDVIRTRLTSATRELSDACGCTCRVCVDSAPILERYWAVKAGVGFIGRNSQLIIPNHGSRFFLAEIITSLDITPDPPSPQSCLDCGKCIAACPGKAINPDGTIDARKCNSYLTIESRQPIPESANLSGYVYGCDICQNVCPHNSPLSTRPILPEFTPRASILTLTASDIATLSPELFSTLFRKSSIKRTKLSGLHRNVNFLLNSND